MKKLCEHCNKDYLDHKADSLSCPIGKKTRMGYLHYSETKKFKEKLKK